jgi:hypothetical protein
MAAPAEEPPPPELNRTVATTAPAASRPKVMPGELSDAPALRCYRSDTLGVFVIVAVRAQARGRRSAVPMDVRMFHAFEMRDGKVQRMWGYLDEADAVEAVGLRE